MALSLLCQEQCCDLSFSQKAGSPHTAELPCAGVRDRSELWVACLEKGLPQLPSTKRDVEAVLFPARSDMRIPVTPVFYEYMATCYPCTATQFLERADASSLVAALSTLLDPEYTKFFTGQTSSHLIVEFVAKVFSSLRHWSTQRVRCSIRLNSTEPCRADCGGTFAVSGLTPWLP